MTKSKTKKHQENLMSMAKNTIKLGAVTSIGSYGFSRLGSSNPALKKTSGSLVTGLNLVNIGNLANIGLNILPKNKK